MAIRLWPKDYERKDHITKAEKSLLRYATRNFQNGHIAVGIDSIGLSNETTKMGMYISPKEGLITFSLYPGKINALMIQAYISYAEMVEQKIYERLLDSKLLIVRNGDKKALKFPYKHIVIFPEESIGKVSASPISSSNCMDMLHLMLSVLLPLTVRKKGSRICVFSMVSGKHMTIHSNQFRI